MAESLFQMNVILDFIKLLIWTGQLSDERPVSAIIVAPAGAGKTTMLESLANQQAIFLGDLTSRNISSLVRGDKEVTHVLLGDMLAIFGHKESTVKLTRQLISQMTGEKLKQDPWTGAEIAGRQIGLISAIPPEDFNKRQIQTHVRSGGFASRFLIVRYSYKPSTIASIHRFIASNGYAKTNPTTFVMPNTGKWEVAINKDLSEKVKDFGASLKSDPLGFRAHRHLRALVKASARREARPQANEHDLEIVQSYCDFFSREGKEI